jgi:hypothetical protein
LWAKGLIANDAHKEMFAAYGREYSSRKAVHNWVEKFSQEISKVADEIGTEATVQRVEGSIRADRRITIDSVETALGCSHALA